MIASIGATNAQMTPFSVDNQQLEAMNSNENTLKFHICGSPG